jgi:menaquinone-dependent protoporphyrinogen oxidase
MKVLVAYASKYGSTKAIAERIAGKISERGSSVDAMPVKAVQDVSGYDAYVVGSALYILDWMKDAKTFVDRNREFLASRPLWLFSSGPISPGTTDMQGRDARTTCAKKEIMALKDELHARDHHVFWGALDKKKLALPERLIASMPAFPGTEGDFRDWNEIDAWSATIAEELVAAREVPESRPLETTTASRL